MSLEPKQKKALLGVGIALCLAVASAKIYKFYLAHTAPYAVGECFQLNGTPVGPIKFQVLENDRKEGTTTAVGHVDMFGIDLQIPVKASFQEIRESDTKKVDCK